MKSVLTFILLLFAVGLFAQSTEGLLQGVWVENDNRHTLTINHQFFKYSNSEDDPYFYDIYEHCDTNENGYDYKCSNSSEYGMYINIGAIENNELYIVLEITASTLVLKNWSTDKVYNYTKK